MPSNALVDQFAPHIRRIGVKRVASAADINAGSLSSWLCRRRYANGNQQQLTALQLDRLAQACGLTIEVKTGHPQA